VSTRNPGVYVARLVSDVYVRAGNSFDKLSDAHRSSQIEETGNQEPDWVSNNRNQGVPEKEWDARAVLIPESADDSVENKDREPCYCLLEIMNTGSSPVEIVKNVKLGDGQPFELRGGGVVENEIRAVGENFETNGSDKSESVETHAVFNVSEVDDASSTPSELKRIILEKLGHLVKTERKALAPVMSKYYDLFLYDRSGHYRSQ